MPLDKTDAPAAQKQRPERTPTRLLSPEQKRAKRARWKANRRKRVGGRPAGEGTDGAWQGDERPDYRHLSGALNRQAAVLAFGVESVADIRNRDEESLSMLVESLLRHGEALRRVKQRERKRVYRKPRTPKNQLDKALRIL